jgi:hypothetical protein
MGIGVMQGKEWLKVLETNKLMQSLPEVAAFEGALEKLAENPDLALLPDLHLVLDDRCQQPEVLFSLIHFLESFDVVAQISAFVQVAPKLIFTAPEWVKVLHTRILNDEISLPVYKDVLRDINQAEPNFIRQLLEDSVTYHLADRYSALRTA